MDMNLQIVLVFLIGVTISNADVYGILDPYQISPQNCYDKALNLTIPRGGSAQHPTKCERVICIEGLNTYGHHCGKPRYGMPDCVYFPEDVSKPFPECCASVKCSNNRTNIY